MQYSDNLFLQLSLPRAKIVHSTPGIYMSNHVRLQSIFITSVTTCTAVRVLLINADEYMFI